MKKANFALGASLVALSSLLFSAPSFALDPCEPDDPDLVAYWKFDEGSGTTVFDFTDNDFDGTLINGASFTGSTAPTSFDNSDSLELDGVNDYVDLGTNVGNFTLTGAFSISAWINPVLSSTDQVIYGNAWALAGYQIRVTSANRVRFIMITNGSNYRGIDSGVLSPGWHHVVGVWDGASPKVYVDGSPGTLPIVGGTLSTITTAAPTQIGRSPEPGFENYFDGLIDDLRVFERVLSAQEIDDLAAGMCFTMYCQGQAVTILGTPGDDVIPGTAGSDVIHGLGGNDTIDGDGGNDVICGGDGDDEITAGDGNDSVEGNDGEDEIYGGDGRDTLHGNDDDDFLEGNDGDDWIFGDDGIDEIHGGMDRDRLFGGFGDDMIFGDGGNDTIYGEFGNDTMEGGEDRDTIHGSFGDDKLYGDGGDDRLYGDLDDDELHGGAGDDRLYGSIGDDDLFGDGGDDRLDGSIGEDFLDGGADDDRLDGGNDDDTVIGRTGEDTLKGGIGLDTLCGNEGDDRLDGGIGDDLLDGGADTDRLKGSLGDDDCFNGESHSSCELITAGPTVCVGL